MKSIRFFLLTTFVIFTSIGYAQQNKTAEEFAKERQDSMTRLYKLTKEQSQQVYDATLQFRKRAEEVQAMNIPVPERRKLLRKADHAFEGALIDIFTEQQYQKLLEVRKQLAERDK